MHERKYVCVCVHSGNSGFIIYERITTWSVLHGHKRICFSHIFPFMYMCVCVCVCLCVCACLFVCLFCPPFSLKHGDFFSLSAFLSDLSLSLSLSLSSPLFSLLSSLFSLLSSLFSLLS